MRLLSILLPILAWSIGGHAIAGPLDDAVAAHDRHDYATTLQLLRPLAEQGDVSAQYYLGAMYDLGEGTPQDYATAASWYRRAAEQGHSRAQYFLAVMYAVGKGVPRSDVQAYMWCELAASRSDKTQQEQIAGLRKALSGRMSAPQLAEARRMAAAWTVKAERPQ